jgi:carbamoyl-phosphate synthase large subunit
MNKPKTILILGSGGLKIGQAGEFDYSGSQAIKTFKQEHIRTILINPNIATVQTDPDMADVVYFQPLTPSVVTRIIQKERPDAIALSFGGQTALNLGLKLHHDGTLQKYHIRVLGTPVSVIETTEDRELFKKSLTSIGVKTATSRSARTLGEAITAAKAIGYPLMMRSGFSLGGLGSGLIRDEPELIERATTALLGAPQILIEEYLRGWKEIEYEVVRDHSGSIITVCNMENFDPMGIHTGESIVVAPSQTLTNAEYHGLRETALKTISHLGIIGECNIQYALDPKTGDYRVIEVNARLSRSSALASKATGYPLAAVAAKLMLGYTLPDITNAVTGTTSAFFEPALDYIAVKMPRWDLTKLGSIDRSIGSEMKSVGEVMALGRSFPEALQKAIRMTGTGAQGLTDHPYHFSDPARDIAPATDRRLYAIFEYLKDNRSVQETAKLSGIDPWFLHQLSDIAQTDQLLQTNVLSNELLRKAKLDGFSDITIASRTNRTPSQVRALRHKLHVTPFVKQIDTLAGEADSTTNYLYMTYHGSSHDVDPLASPLLAQSPVPSPVVVLGSGPYCIGSSVEFDWCAVGVARTLRAHSVPTIMVNSNPETVSTDFDRSDRLYFEELTLERIADIADFEQNPRIVISVGGQAANNLALPLAEAGYVIMGTPATSIDMAEDRQKFSALLNKLHIDQPEWQEVTTLGRAKQFAQVVTYPVLIRPSYVLSGGAMNVVTSPEDLERYLTEATDLSPDHPVVMSRFIRGAKELEIDGVAQNGDVVISAISEHIENAGIHSGDATVVLPPQRLYLETIRQAKRVTKEIIHHLQVTGPFNIQFIATTNELKVIEVNVRASRSFPFVSKVTGYNFITIATEVMLGAYTPSHYETLDLDYVGVKSPQFSYNRLKGADPVAGVEMASTGEVASIGDNLLEAFYASWLATDQALVGRNVFLSVPDDHKHKFTQVALALSKAGWHILATMGTRKYLADKGIQTEPLYKLREHRTPTVQTAIAQNAISLMVNVPSSTADDQDAFDIRRLAIDHHVPLITNAEVAVLVLRCLTEVDYPNVPIKSWQEYVRPARDNIVPS